LRPGTLLELLERVDVFRRPDRFERLLEACLCDARGRTGFEDAEYPQVAYLREAADVARGIEAGALVAAGFKDEALGAELRKRRLERLTEWIAEIRGRPGFPERGKT
jgi:tRNA nucleotidyltransferase (CCA-adding enzyme)